LGCTYLYPLMKFIFYGILIWLLYKLVFDFIIPVSRATRQIKSKIREAQQQQQRFQEQRNMKAPQFQQKDPPADTEYIDYEEVK
jgi:uncharacterized membrane protein (DUF106 family)